MIRFFKYFQFTTIERNGFLMLCFGIICTNIALFAYKLFNKKEKPISHRMYKLGGVEVIAEKPDKDAVIDHSPAYVKTSFSRKDIRYFTFDPNTASSKDWHKLGLSDRQTQVIQNYLAKGGRFYKKEDLKKIYSISAKDYQLLEPYIAISQRQESRENEPEKKVYTNNKVYDEPNFVAINLADTSELKRLNGIGTVLAARIVKFRDALGGFHSVDQLKEVYGITDESFQRIKSKLTVAGHEIKKLSINKMDMAALDKHPYISKKQAQGIVNYRLQHGDYTDMNTLSQNKALDQEFLRKIEPYLEF